MEKLLGARQVLRSNELRDANHQPRNPYKIQIFSNNKENVLIWGKNTRGPFFTSQLWINTHIYSAVSRFLTSSLIIITAQAWLVTILTANNGSACEPKQKPKQIKQRRMEKIVSMKGNSRVRMWWSLESSATECLVV